MAISKAKKKSDAMPRKGLQMLAAAHPELGKRLLSRINDSLSIQQTPTRRTPAPSC